MEHSSKSHPGQAVYSPLVLRIYDWWVLSVSNRWIWKCPTAEILSWFNQHASTNHLDVGVGTGYYPDHATFPRSDIRLGLMDLNTNCLQYATTRLKRFQPEQFRNDILAPIPQQIAKFDSISLNYVLHCLPEPLTQKACVLDHLLPLLKEGGCLFGSTILGPTESTSKLARLLMKKYNQRGIFGNDQDSIEELQNALSNRFSTFDIKQVGQIALFVGWYNL